jgi:hypothetical protein
MEDRSIEPSGAAEKARLELTLNDRELSLLWMSLARMLNPSSVSPNAKNEGC